MDRLAVEIGRIAKPMLQLGLWKKPELILLPSRLRVLVAFCRMENGMKSEWVVTDVARNDTASIVL